MFSVRVENGKRATADLDSQKQNRKSEKLLRLHKYLASCGLGSRRACETLVADGRISVDGAIVREQGVCINPACQAVCLDRQPVTVQTKIFLVLNKPPGFLCTSHDPQGRRTFLSLLPALPQRVFTVGRLDCDSEGLLLVTNDGDLAHALMHPRHGVEKIYKVWTATPLTPEQEQRMCTGVFSQGERLCLLDIKAISSRSAKFLYQVRLVAGRNRHIRRMFETLGVTILRLQRVAIGPLALDRLPAKLIVKLPVGAWRHLKDDEIQALRHYVTPRLHSC